MKNVVVVVSAVLTAMHCAAVQAQQRGDRVARGIPPQIRTLPYDAAKRMPSQPHPAGPAISSQIRENAPRAARGAAALGGPLKYETTPAYRVDGKSYDSQGRQISSPRRTDR